MHPFHFGGDLRTAQDESDLRAVAVTDGHVPALLDHIRNVKGGLAQRLLLVFDGYVFIVFDQRVATDGDYS